MGERLNHTKQPPMIRPPTQTLKSVPCLGNGSNTNNNTLLTNRGFRVCLGQNTSARRTRTNGLPQGSVLAPTFFNLYTNDQPTTKFCEFILLDDICLAFQAPDLDQLERVLTEDLDKLDQLYKTWRLKPSPAKTESSIFPFHNAKASGELNIYLGGLRLKHGSNPTYLEWPLTGPYTSRNT